MKSLKSKREIAKMRRAGVAVWRAHQLAAPLVQPGTTTGELDAVVEDFFASIQATPLFKDYPHGQRGKPAFPAVTCISVNDEVVHGIPGPRVLQEGDVVSIDTGCRLDGWCGDAAITHPVGHVDDQVQRLLETTDGVLALAIELMASKSRWSEVADEMAKFVADHGFATVECFVGHGIGREMHEEPQVPNFASRSLRHNGDFSLEPGLVIAVEPMVNMGTKRVKVLDDDWTQATRDGQPSAHFEHTIAITDDGPWPLTAAPSPEEMEESEFEPLLATRRP